MSNDKIDTNNDGLDSKTEADEDFELNDSQQTVVDSDDYPMRVLAGAGTGKTATMVRKIESLVIDGVPPDDILALTFTNKAADSMRAKLADRLDDPEKAYDITATTYHAIADKLVTEHAYYANLDPEYDIADEVERSKLIYDVLNEIPYQFTDPTVYEPDYDGFASGVETRLSSFIAQFKSAKITPDKLETHLPPAETLANIGKLIATLREIGEDTLYIDGRRKITHEELERVKSGLAESLEQVVTCRQGLPNEDAVEPLDELLRDLKNVFNQLERLLEEVDEDKIDGAHQGYLKAPAYFLGQYGNAPKGVPELDTRPIDHAEEIVRDWQRATDLVNGYYAYQQRLEEQDLLDYDDLIYKAQELFDNSAIGEQLQDRYSYVFCDEFQDTDKAQMDLVCDLVDNNNLFVVGDEDQAIYEWRGANPKNIQEDIEEKFPNLTTEKLEHNYRSRPDVLTLVNNMIDDIETQNTAKKLDPDRDRREDATVASIHAFTAERGAKRIGEAIELLTKDQAPGIDASVSYGDVAVLVRNNSHARDLVPVFEQRDIPYELAGSLASNSVGVETVIAYLKLIVDIDSEVPLDRVLLLRYRLPESDIDRLHEYNGPTVEALNAVPASELAAPEQARTAYDHITELKEIKKTHSLSRIYEQIKRTTNIELFLTADEREELRYLDEIVANYDDAAIERPLTEDFIEHLRHSVSSLVEDNTEGVEPSDKVVSVLTIHKAKGLEFPVVFMPRVSEDTWGPSVRSQDRIRSVIENKSLKPAIREAQEQRRVFHVGLTRAEDLLVLCGSGGSTGSSQDEEEGNFTWDPVFDELPDDTDLQSPDVSFPVWELTSKSCPKTSADWTEATERAVGDSNNTAHDCRDQSEIVAENEVMNHLEKTLDNKIEPQPVSTLDIEKAVLGESASPTALRKHSYSAIDRLDQCERWHYLSNIAYAFPDPPEDSRTEDNHSNSRSENAPSGTDTDLSTEETSIRRQIPANVAGTIFHETAERAAPDPDCTTVEEWNHVAEDIASNRGIEWVPERVQRCIENYHDSRLSDWEIVATEWYFETNFGDAPEYDRPLVVRGYIDAIYKHKGSYYVVDYKTNEAFSNDHRKQAKIYMMACREAFDYDVSAAHIWYLNRGPEETIDIEKLGGVEAIRSEIRDTLVRLNRSSYANPTADSAEVCRRCPHNNLPCSKWSPDASD